MVKMDSSNMGSKKTLVSSCFQVQPAIAILMSSVSAEFPRGLGQTQCLDLGDVVQDADPQSYDRLVSSCGGTQLLPCQCIEFSSRRFDENFSNL